MEIEGLDVAAWERWEAYRKAIRKPIKSASEHAMKLKLARFGDEQAEVVDQSIANQYQGLFPLKKEKLAPGEKPKRTQAQIAAADAAFTAQQGYMAKGWDERISDPIGKLKACDALWARYTISPDADTPERLEWLKGVIAMHLRAADAKKVVTEPDLMTMVWCFFGAAGAKRIKERAAA